MMVGSRHICALALLLAVPDDAADAAAPRSEPAGCEVYCEWPARARPEALLQASRCAGLPTEASALQRGDLVRLEDLPACLQPAFAALAAAITEGAGVAPRKAVLRARIARQFYEASAYYQPTGSQVVYLPSQIDQVMDVLQREWPDYASPDGELGWSGFLLVIDGGDVRVRVMHHEPRPSDVWYHSEEILSEFFAGSSVQPLVR